MGGHGRQLRPVDVVRKALIVVVLLGGILLLHRFAVPNPDFDSRGLLALGLIVLAAYTIGELAEVVRVPHITGYLLAGLVLGPSVAHALHGLVPTLRLPPPLDAGVLSPSVIRQLGVVDGLALALIALTAGGELKLDSLRAGARQVGAVLGAQTLLVAVGVTGFLFGTVRLFPDALPSLWALDTPALLALSAVVGAISVSTSPAATVALVNSMHARGPVSSTVLTTVVLKEFVAVFLFAVATTWAVGALGIVGAPTLGDSLGRMALSMVLGVVVGAGIHLYLRFVGVELLLFIVGLVYTATFAVQGLGGQPALTFLVAGVVVGNFSDLGKTLIAEVERLSMPVYVVFFTLAGAKLHLDELSTMLLPAVGLVGTRALALFAGVRAGAFATAAPPAVGRVGWMGFVSQAGLAIVLSNQVQRLFRDDGLGETLFSLLLGAVAINEMIGPAMLQRALLASGEAAGARGDRVSEQGDPEGDASVPDDGDAWARPPGAGWTELDDALDRFHRDVRTLVIEGVSRPLDERRVEVETCLRTLRREYLGTTRNALLRVSVATQDAAGLATLLREDVGVLAERWRELVAAPATAWSPLALVDGVDRHLVALPETLTAPVPAVVTAPRPEPFLARVRRTLLRTRERFWPLRREVPLRGLARYRLSGEVPGLLEPLAAWLVADDVALAGRIAGLFSVFAQGFEDAARIACAGADGAVVKARIEVLRLDLEERFRSALEDVATGPARGADHAARAFGGALRRLGEDAVTAGTIDLPHRRRRFARVFDERNRGLTVLSSGLSEARTAVRSRYAGLSLELELAGFVGRAQDAVRTKGASLAVRVRELGTRQIGLVDAALRVWLEASEAAIGADATAAATSQRLRRDAEPLAERLRDARASIDLLDRELADEAWVADLTEALLRLGQPLTERYSVPSSPMPTTPGRLPASTPTTDVPFHDLVMGLVESRIGRDLHDGLGDLGRVVHEMGTLLVEVERVVSFNLELAVAELDAVGDRPIDAATRELLRGMAVVAIGRHHQRVGRVADRALQTSAGVEDRVHATVIGQLDRLRVALLEAPEAVLRTARVTRRQLGRRVVAQAQDWQGVLPEARSRSRRILERGLGRERLAALRRALGLRSTRALDLKAALAPPTATIEVPVVYRRLFEELPFEGGDLLAGRQGEIRRLCAALAPTNALRSAAVVGIDPHSARAVVNSATRDRFEGVLSFDAGGPADLATVERWLAEASGVRDHVVVIDGVRWLYQRIPGGMDPIRRLADGILAERGRNAYVLIADAAVWRYVTTATPIGTVMGVTVELDGLTVEELERAVLSRHAVSGHEVVFEAADGWARPALLGGEDSAGRERAWFRTLHRASAGVLQDAFRLWTASVREVDDVAGRVRIGPVPSFELVGLEELPDPVMVTLLETTRQGWITSDVYARLFRVPVPDAAAHLASLVQCGLFVEGDRGVHWIAPHLRGPVHRTLAGRGWS